MNIDIKFINDTTAEISASLKWWAIRPPRDLKEVRTAADGGGAFTKKHPSYIVENVEGPHRIFNCKREEQSKGKWTLTVSKKVRQKKNVSKKTAPPKTAKKGA